MRIISGGQTGVDRAALDAAFQLNLNCGGWCPKGRKAEDGSIDQKYPLKETPTNTYKERTEWNVRDSDGTLILTWGEPKGGTKYTVEMVKRHKKPLLIVNLETPTDVENVRAWIKEKNIDVLNVAGPRGSFREDVYDEAFKLLMRVLG